MKKGRNRVKVDLQRWAAYGIASSAVTLNGTASLADIHLISPDIVMADSDPSDFSAEVLFHLDMSGESRVNLEFSHFSNGNSGIGWIAGYVHPFAPDSFELAIAGYAFPSDVYPYNFAYGQFVSNHSAFYVNSNNNFFPGMVLAGYNGFGSSQFVNEGGFVGLRFNVGNGTQYGWVEFGLESGTPENIFRLKHIGWADPGEPIFTGQMPVPEAGSLGLLAIGATGLLAWRRRRLGNRWLNVGTS